MTQNNVTIKRRINKGGKYVEIKEKASLVKRKAKTSLVKLENGDIIRRKDKDIIWEKS